MPIFLYKCLPYCF